MKTRYTITKLIAITMVVAALAAASLLNGARWLQPVEAPAPASIGFIPGQRLSFSVFNPPEEGGAPVRAQAYIYDATGRLLTRSAEVDLRPDQGYTFAFNRDDLPLAGEPGTGRLQVRAVIKVVLMGRSVRPVNLPVWMAVVNNRRGGTSGGNYSTGYVKVSDDGFGGS